MANGCCSANVPRMFNASSFCCGFALEPRACWKPTRYERQQKLNTESVNMRRAASALDFTSLSLSATASHNHATCSQAYGRPLIVEPISPMLLSAAGRSDLPVATRAFADSGDGETDMSR